MVGRLRTPSEGRAHRPPLGRWAGIGDTQCEPGPSRMRFVAYNDASSVPNVIVDGRATGGTVLTLSHWPKSGTPAALRGDTSTAIVFNYIDKPPRHAKAEAVSNNHFDEDGLVGIFALLDPAEAVRRRDLLIDVASAGDFGVFHRREAARIAFTLHAHAEAGLSPLPTEIFDRPYPALVAELYVRLLDILPRLVSDINRYQAFWKSEDVALTASEAAIHAGSIAIEEQPSLDLAIVRVPAKFPTCHSFAIHSRTGCSRLLVIHGLHVELQYRYEGWVQMASRRPAARVDLAPLADELNQQEKSGGAWTFDGVDEITPKLSLENSPETSIPLEIIFERVIYHLRNGAPSWNPYDES